MINGPEGGPVTGIAENQTAYNIVENEEEDSAEITMYGEVVQNRPESFWTGKKNDGLYIVLGEFLNDLEKVKGRSRITVRINSPGGDLYAGIAIMNRLTELQGDVVTIVDGLAASAASIILQGGKTRKVHSGCMVMVHGVSTLLYGRYNITKLKEIADQLNAANRAAAETYVKKTGLSRDEILSIMEKTEWMTGQEAIDKGFADELVETGSVSMSMTPDNMYMIVNGIQMPAGGFETLPAGIQAVASEVIPGENPVIADKKNNEGGEKKMTAKELREKYPELVAEIEGQAAAQQGAGKEQEEAVKNAIEAERKRISEIDEIAGMVSDKSLLHKAKFEEPMTAAQLALETMKQQAKLGAQFMKDYQEDVKDSGVNGVNPVPGGDMLEEMEQDDIAKGAALIAGKMEGD